MIIIHGAITLLSPLHTSAGNKGLRLTPEGLVTSKDNETGISVVSTLTQPLTTRGRYYGHIPYFPASAVIGQLRRFASLRVRTALLNDDKKLPPATYYALQHGQPATSQTGAVASLDYYNAVKQDLFFGLFGGASLRNKSLFSMCDMLPIIPATVEASLVPQRYADLAPVSKNSGTLEPHQLVDYRVIRRIDNLRRGNDTMSGDDVSLEDLKELPKTEAAAAYQTIIPGMNLYFKCMLSEQATQAQRGLLLLAISDWINENRLGARVHLGWGRFTAQRFRFIDGTNRADLFELQEDDEGIISLSTSKQYEQLVSAAREQLDAYAKAPEAARAGFKKLLHPE